MNTGRQPSPERSSPPYRTGDERTRVRHELRPRRSQEIPPLTVRRGSSLVTRRAARDTKGEVRSRIDRRGRLAGAAATAVLVALAMPTAASLTAVRARTAYWSAGGQVIAFWDGNRLWMMNADGTRRRPIAPLSDNGAGNARLSPSGRFVAVTDVLGRAFLVVRRVGGPIVKRIRWRAPEADVYAAIVWSPDERAIAMAASFGTLASSRIFVVDVRKGRVRKLRRSRPGVDEAPAWSPDSRRIAFHSCGLQAPCQLALVRADGQGRRIISRGISVRYLTEIAWAPNGRAIAFGRPFGPGGPTLQSPQRWGVYVHWLRTGSVRRVAATPRMRVDEVPVAWSPDGRRLAFSDTRGISLADVSSGRQTVITSRGRRARISWSPARSILFVDDGSIYTVTPRRNLNRVFP